MPFSNLQKDEESNHNPATKCVDDKTSFSIQRLEYIKRIAHDLKTPIVGAKEILQLILSGSCGHVEPELEVMLLLLKENNEEVLRMTQCLVKIYHYEAGLGALNLGICDFILILNQSIAKLKSIEMAAASNISFTSTEKQCMLAADQSAIEEMLNCLLVNIAKHIVAGGQLAISLGKSAANAILTLQAAGLKIMPSDLNSIFLLFCEQSPSYTYAPLTGLELHLGGQIVRAHKGLVRAEKRNEDDVMIIIELPMVDRTS